MCHGVRLHEDSSPVTILLVESIVHEYTFLFPPGTKAWQLPYLAHTQLAPLYSPLSVAMKTAVYWFLWTYGDSRSKEAEVLTVPLTGFTLSQPAGSRRTAYLVEEYKM